jgi:hypothetical protein
VSISYALRGAVRLLRRQSRFQKPHIQGRRYQRMRPVFPFSRLYTTRSWPTLTAWKLSPFRFVSANSLNDLEPQLNQDRFLPALVFCHLG